MSAEPRQTQRLNREAVIDAYQRTWEAYQRSDNPGRFRDDIADAVLALVWSAEQQPLSLDHAAQQRALAARLETSS